MATELIVNASLPETRIALMENGEIQEVLIERATGKGIVGNIYKGRVTRVLPGMQAAFVDIGLEKAAFLYVDDVFVHSDIWAEEEGTEEEQSEAAENEVSASGGEAGTNGEESPAAKKHTGIRPRGEIAPQAAAAAEAGAGEGAGDLEEGDDESDLPEYSEEEADVIEAAAQTALGEHPELLSEEEAEDQMAELLADDEDEEEDEGDDDPVSMGAEGDDEEPKGTISPKKDSGGNADDNTGDNDGADFSGDDAGGESNGDSSEGSGGEEGGGLNADGTPNEGGTAAERGRRRRRGRRGGRNRKRGREDGAPGEQTRVEGREGAAPNPNRIVIGGASRSAEDSGSNEEFPESFHEQVSEAGEVGSDRSEMSAQLGGGEPGSESDRPEGRAPQVRIGGGAAANGDPKKTRPEFREPRNKDRKIRSKQSTRPSRMNVSIQDLLKEGQEVIVQIAKDPIATKGARLTCHISLPGRHLVCMPTIDHVGVSRRIEKDEERRRLREYVDRNRPKGLGFIVRTATSSGKAKAELRIKQDIDYLSALWSEIKSKANSVHAPALVYEDLNPILRAIRDWVNEDIDKIVVDSRYSYNDVQRFVRNFMPGIGSKIELYQGDVPIFDTYGISTELARGLERKVWLKSGGYLVVDQAEALVAIDVNTGRYVGKKSLEDTILKTNLEAVKEICYQLRLRNCGGIIILDLIDMEREENKLRVYRALEEELKKDRSRPQILKISELGLVEMTRKRTRDTMVRALCDSCSQCEGKGYIKSKLTVAYEIMRDVERDGVVQDSPKLLIQAHPDVIDVLAIDERESLDALERRYKKQIYLQAVQDFHPEQFELIGDKRPGKRSEEALLDRARELAQTSDPRRGRRGRDRGRGKSGGRDSGSKEGGQDREARRGSGGGGRDRDRGDKNRTENRHASDRPRISIRPAGAEGGANPAADGATDEFQNTGDSNPGYSENTGNRDDSMNTGRMTPPDDSATDEDRLAYQRAQAAQDAALAAKGGASGGRGAGAAGDGQGRGGKWAGGAGGERGGAGGGRGDRGGRGRRGGRGGKGRFQGGVRADKPGTAGGPPTPVSASGGDSGGGDSGGGSGGDRSNPPTTE